MSKSGMPMVRWWESHTAAAHAPSGTGPIASRYNESHDAETGQFSSGEGGGGGGGAEDKADEEKGKKKLFTLGDTAHHTDQSNEASKKSVELSKLADKHQSIAYSKHEPADEGRKAHLALAKQYMLAADRYNELAGIHHQQTGEASSMSAKPGEMLGSKKVTKAEYEAARVPKLKDEEAKKELGRLSKAINSHNTKITNLREKFSGQFGIK